MNSKHYEFQLPPLPYNYDALEPYIDTLTMQLHHDRHLKTYVDNLNAALKDYPAYHDWSLQRLIKDSNWLPDSIKLQVKRNAGGVYNHEFFFSNMISPQQRGALSNQLEEKIRETFESFEDFKSQFKKAALSVFGSGYAWLVADKKGELKIIITLNQDTPLPLDMYPILCIDVWEHAYYLKHYNLRADYIDDFFNIINLNMISDNFKNRLS